MLLLCGCAGKDLRDWHTKRLYSEFSADDADSVLTLADYQALEDELFAEMVDIMNEAARNSVKVYSDNERLYAIWEGWVCEPRGISGHLWPSAKELLSEMADIMSKVARNNCKDCV